MDCARTADLNKNMNLKPRKIYAKAEDGTEFERSVGVTLLDDGTFSIELPEELVACAEKVKVTNAHVGHARSGARAKVYAKELDAGLRLIKAAADDYIQAEEVREHVICYKANVDVSFWQEPNGTIAPNGCGRKGQWWESKLFGHQYDACHRLDSMSIGFAAKVFDKITTKRKSGDTVRYEQTDVPLHVKHTDPMFLLNSWTVLDIEPKRQGVREMPYTPEAALFFHNLQCAICKMAMGLYEFIADEKKLMLAIQSGTKLLGK